MYSISAVRYPPGSPGTIIKNVYSPPGFSENLPSPINSPLFLASVVLSVEDV